MSWDERYPADRLVAYHPRWAVRYAEPTALLLEAVGVWGSDDTDRKTAFVLRVVNRARAERGLPAVVSL